MVKSAEILLDLRELEFYDDNYLELAKYLDKLSFEKNDITESVKNLISDIFKFYPGYKKSLQEVYLRDGKELFLIRSKLSILEQISSSFIKEESKVISRSIKKQKFDKQSDFMLIYFTLNKALQEKSVELVEKLEREKARIRIEERNKIIANLSHSIKNMISTVIDPLENLKNESMVQKQVVDNALRGANLIREMVNAMNLSFKGSNEDFYYDARHNTGSDRMEMQNCIIAALKYSVRNMFDGKYFANFMRKYFPNKKIYVEAKSEWQKISGSNSVNEIYPFLKKYFFDCNFELDGIDKFAIGNEKGSAIKLLILFQEIILNAVKYTSFVEKENRTLQVFFIGDSRTISIKVENSYKEKVKTKTSGIGHTIIENFAKLLKTEPEIEKKNGIYSVEIKFENIWEGHAK